MKNRESTQTDNDLIFMVMSPKVLEFVWSNAIFLLISTYFLGMVKTLLSGVYGVFKYYFMVWHLCNNGSSICQLFSR
jgi:uncharacterized membrane-anchored protein YitT (DUF2179 family)